MRFLKAVIISLFALIAVATKSYSQHLFIDILVEADTVQNLDSFLVSQAVFNELAFGVADTNYVNNKLATLADDQHIDTLALLGDTMLQISLDGDNRAASTLDLSSLSSTTNWSLSGNDIYNNNSGKVGIGTSSPQKDLHIVNDNSTTELRLQSTDATARNVQIRVLNAIQEVNYQLTTQGRFLYRNVTNSSVPFSLDLQNNDYIGFGIATPLHRIHAQDGLGQTTAFIENTSTGDPQLQFGISGSTKYSIGVDNSDSDKLKIGTSNLNTGNVLTISGSNLGVGTQSPAVQLHTDGTVRFDNLATGTIDKVLATTTSNNVIEVDVSSVQDGTGTDDQTIDHIGMNGTTLEMSLEGDGEANQTVDMPFSLPAIGILHTGLSQAITTGESESFFSVDDNYDGATCTTTTHRSISGSGSLTLHVNKNGTSQASWTVNNTTGTTTNHTDFTIAKGDYINVEVTAVATSGLEGLSVSISCEK